MAGSYSKTKIFFKKTIIGGIVVLVPIGLTVMLARWFFFWVTDFIQPLTDLILKSNDLPEIIGDLFVISMMILICFVVGYLVTTGAGRYLHNVFDRYLIKLAPGYKVIKEIVMQFFGDEANSPFANGQVAVAQIYGKDIPTYATVLVTSKHSNGDYTVFFPTGPNPTSGQILHLKSDLVEIREDIPVESAMRTIIACGAGSGQILRRDHKDN